MGEHAACADNCKRNRLLVHASLWIVWAAAILIAPALAFTANPHALDMSYYLWTSAIPLAVLTAALAYAFRGVLAPRRQALVTATVAASALYVIVLATWYVFASQGSVQKLAALTMPEWILRYVSWMLWGLTLPLVGNGDRARDAAVSAADRLGLSPSTITTYRARACEKLGVASFDELVPTQPAPAEPTPPTAPPPTARPFDLDSRAVPPLVITLLCLALLARGLLVAPRAGLPILALALAAPAAAALILSVRNPRTFAVRPTLRVRILLAGAAACGLLVGGAPGFANLGIGLMGHAQYVSGYLIALVFYLVGAAFTLGLLARESAPAEVAIAGPASLDAERCILYLRGRGAGEMQAQALLRIAQGGTATQIAEELHIARGTVNAYRARGYQLLGVHSARELSALLARDTGLHAG